MCWKENHKTCTRRSISGRVGHPPQRQWLNKFQTVKKESKFLWLNAFVNKNEMLRIGWRLTKSTFPIEVKHPLILPRKNHVTKLMIKHCHMLTVHQGCGMSMHYLRNRGFWIIGCRPTLSLLFFPCIVCWHFRGSTHIQKIAVLPEDKIQAALLFSYSGLLWFFPNQGGQKNSQRYGVIFTYMSFWASGGRGKYNDRCFHKLPSLCHINPWTGANHLMWLRVKFCRCKKWTGNRTEQAGYEHVENHQKCDFIHNTPASSHMDGYGKNRLGP